MTDFSGFGSGTRDFLRVLGANNEKAWFEAHRADYEDDVFSADFTLPGGLEDTPRRLSVTVADFALQQMDADPRTPVDWVEGAWSGYEDENGVAGDVGGTDSSLMIGRESRRDENEDDD